MQCSSAAFGQAPLVAADPLLGTLVQQGLRVRYSWGVADCPRGAARHIPSKADVEQGYAVGKAAVQFALKGHNSVMPTIERRSDRPYRWKVGMAPLSKVANVEKMMPKHFITKDGFGITEACRDYLLPLIRGEDYPPYKNGLPNYVRLRNTPVPKRLATAFEVK